MLELFWELRQQQGIADATSAARESAGRVITAEQQVERLNDTVQRLILINMAMWSLLQEKTGLKEEDLIQRCREIDLDDGVEDGRVQQLVADCPKCRRPYSQKHNRCLYCGYIEQALSAFDALG